MKHKIFEQKTIPQALIVRQAPLSNFDAFLKDYLKFLICDKHGCNQCIWCKKIDGGQYLDLEIADGKTLKKDYSTSIINKFYNHGVEEKNIRVYVIKNIEYARKEIVNSLLKFIEEPPVGVYALFSTRNFNAIIPTIRSRCYNIYLEQDTKSVDQFLNLKDSEIKVKELAKKCFYNLDDLKDQYEDFEHYYELAKNLGSKQKLTFANEGLNEFKKMNKDQISLFLEICKHLYKNVSLELIKIQDNLYLNTNKTLVFAKVFDLLGGK